MSANGPAGDVPASAPGSANENGPGGTEADGLEASISPLLQQVLAARRARLDAQRGEAVAKQHRRGRCTAREAVSALLDPGSFVEYGGLARPAAASLKGSADGLVMGTGRVDAQAIDIVAYDYTVLAGTQGVINHLKITRMLEHAERHRLPVVCWLDGGGGRPHEMNVPGQGPVYSFVALAKLSGLVPTVAIVPGRAFAGHANLAGLCDAVIATAGACMGMAGPPLVESALGIKMTPEEIGPAAAHFAAGTVDVMVADDRQATAAARRYLGYFGPPQAPGPTPDTHQLRTLVPDDPRYAYDVRKVIAALVDVDSELELRAGFGRAMVSVLARLGGRPLGILANQPSFLAGAIDGAAAEKAARFVQLCDAFDIPLLLLCDTPGLMVGPEAERSGLVRRSARLLSALANATTPILTVVLRKAYGLGYYIMGSRPLRPEILLAWPTAEFGGMGLEGAAAIVHRKELEDLADPAARAQLVRDKAEEMRRANTALEAAARFVYDDVIDPADTRDILLNVLAALPAPPPRTGGKRLVDPT